MFLIVFTALLGVVYKMTSWGRHVLAIGGNEQAALLTGVPVNRIKVQVYVVSGLAAAFAAILAVGWEGSAINALGQSYELLAISAAVIGGANLMGGEASAYGAFIGAAGGPGFKVLGGGALNTGPTGRNCTACGCRRARPRPSARSPACQAWSRTATGRRRR